MKLNKRILNKGLYFILLGAGLSLGTVSCSDYLDTEPITDRPVEVSETPYTKASEAEDLMKTMYVGPGFGHSNYWQLDYFANGSMQTDEAYVSGDNQDNRQQAEYRILSTNGNVKRNWEAIYELINNCNKVLNFVDGIKDPALTAERKAEMKAEAAIVRALYYFHAVQLWGDVPLVTKSVTSVTSENFVTSNYIYKQTSDDILMSVRAPVGSLNIANNDFPSSSQIFQSLIVAIFSGVVATILFFKATDLVKNNMRHLAIVESTQAGEVIFSLLGTVILFNGKMPNLVGYIGLILVVLGMVLNSFVKE